MKRYTQLAIIFLLFVSLLARRPISSATPQATLAYHLYLPLVINDTPPLPIAWIGPGGGVIADLIYDPNNPNIAYAAAWGGGIYKSTDGGQTWQRNNLGLDNLNINVVEVAPKNSLILYAGVYEGKIYKSVDQGISWFFSGQGMQDAAIPYAIEVDPSRSKRIYVSTRGISNNGGPPWNGIVYKSDDGANTWTPVLTNVGGTSQEDWAYDLEIHSGNPQVVYAATHEHGVYRSLDYGENWQAINNGVSDFTARALAIDPHTSFPGTAYLGVFHRTGIFKSANGGDSWSLKNNNISDARIYRTVLDPNNSNILYLATFDHGIMKSTNGGEDWSSIGLGDETILDVAVHATQSQTLLAATLENGLFRSTNGGGQWSHSQQGLNASTVTSVVVLPGDSQTLFASLYPGWVRSTTDGGATWADDHNNLADKYIHALVQYPTQPNIIYALTDSSGLYRRDTQNSSNWQLLGNNFPAVQLQTARPVSHPLHHLDMLENIFPNDALNAIQGTSTPLFAMTFAPTNPSLAYLGTSGAGIYQSVDSGTTWSFLGLSGLSVRSIVVSPADANRIYAATNEAGIVKMSTDGGASWVDTILPKGGDVFALSASLTDPGVIYAATSQGVYQHNGSAWLLLGLDGTKLTAIAAHPSHPGVVYAGGYDGAYVSIDGGLSWTSGPEELKGIMVQAIHFDRNNPSTIYFATRAHGILRTPSK